MTTREVVKILQDQGHEVKYVNRKDGGILIKSIDGISFSGAAGNIQARTMIGAQAELSQAQRTQLKIIKPSKGKKPKEDLFTEQDKIVIKKVQKKYNKNKVPISQGRVTRKLIRKIIAEEGRTAAMKKLEQSERYAEGFAISKNVEALAQYVEHMAMLVEDESGELDDLASQIRAHDGLIRDEWIKPAYDELYTINQGAEIKDVIFRVKAILHLD